MLFKMDEINETSRKAQHEIEQTTIDEQQFV